ncbi:hypothetical protein KUV28_21790 [Ferrimonas balearica]|nr:hypothetical protein [Ferrimonas balearica]
MTLKTHVDLAPKDGGEGWKLAFTTNGMCAYEEETQKPFTSVAETLKGAEEERHFAPRLSPDLPLRLG